MDAIAELWVTLAGTFVATLVGAVVGAWISYLFAKRAQEALQEREQARFDEQQRQVRELFEADQSAAYRSRMDSEFAHIVAAANDLGGTTRKAKEKADVGEAWLRFLGTLEMASIHARGEDFAALIAFRQFAQVPERAGETLWLRISIFVSMIASWRRGDMTLDQLVTGFYRNSHDAPEGGWQSPESDA